MAIVLSLQLNASLQILHSQNDLERKILKGAARTVNRIFLGAIPHIRTRLQHVVRNHMMKTDVYNAMVHNGRLVGELGVVNAGHVINNVVDTLVKTVRVTGKPFNVRAGKMRGGITMKLLDGSFENILKVPGTTYISRQRFRTRSADKDPEIPWLSWLLFEGDKTIIRNYTIVFGQPVYSRTGQAHMRESKTGSWRVPSKFSGTPRNNFITRAFDDMGKDFDKAIEEEITKRIV